jgi:phosphatidate cytidylyltransferase
MSNLTARVLTALIVVPFLLGAMFWSNPIATFALVFVATGIGLREWANMTMPTAPVLERGLTVVLGLALSAQLYFCATDGMGTVLTLTGATLLAFIYLLFRYGDVQTVASRLTAMLAGMLYVSLLLVFLALLKKRGPDGGFWVLLTLTLVWFSDTGAYFAGRFLGPTFPQKLYEAMSPKKTVVGAFGGLAGSFVATVLAKCFYLPHLTWLDCVLLTVPANFLGQVGDLCESMLKRSVGVKDSGALLPGHGGMLDRIDAVLFATPYIFVFARYFYRG